MAITCANLLDLAATLSGSTTECEWRAAASRAYYAALHSARIVGEQPEVDKWLQDTSAIPCGAHEKIILQFAFFQARPDVRAAGYQLRQLKQDREKADYDIGGEFRNKDGLAALAQARDLVRQFDAIAAAAKAKR